MYLPARTAVEGLVGVDFELAGDGFLVELILFIIAYGQRGDFGV